MLSLYSYSLPPSCSSHMAPSASGHSDELAAAALPLTEKEFFHISSTPGEDIRLILRLSEDKLVLMDWQRQLLIALHAADLPHVLPKIRPTTAPRVTSAYLAT